MIGRLILALGAVLVIMWLLARFARRPLAGKSDRVVTVLARQQLNRNASVAVLKVLDRAFVVGVTDQGVSLLSETDLPALEDALSTQSIKSGRVRPATEELTVAAELPRYTAPSAIAPAAPASTAPAASALMPAPLSATPMSGGGHRAASTSRASRGSRGSRGPKAAATGVDPAADGKKSALDGSILSPKTWSSLVSVARDVTVRR